MHVRLLKPLHGWRAFAGEVGVIVLGVLIALAAQQVVENWQWNTEVRAERASLLQEASDMMGVIAIRNAQVPCVDRRLAEIRTVLERHRRGEPLGLAGEISHPTPQTAPRGAWQIALAGQALTHMGHKEKLAFSTAFGWFDQWEKAMQREREVWLRLTPLNSPDLLTEEDWSSVRSAYGQALDINDIVRAAAPAGLKQVEGELRGVKQYARPDSTAPAIQRIVDQICKPVLAPPARA